MNRYLYALVRCVPNPRTGEFVNIAAIAGRPEIGDWSVRQVSNESRVRKLAGAGELEAVHGFLARIGLEIDKQQLLLEEEAAEPLGEGWLWRLYHDHRNVVQLSMPAPIVADNAEDALDILFSSQIVDPISQPCGFITKHRVLAAVREAYVRAGIDDTLIRSRVEIYAGGHVHAPVDFAVGNGEVIQLTQGWSFQKAGVDEVSMQVKAWGYALRLVRDGEAARVVGPDERLTTVSRDVDLQVVVASPKNREQAVVFDEARQVFTGLRVGARRRVIHACCMMSSAPSGIRAHHRTANGGRFGWLWRRITAYPQRCRRGGLPTAGVRDHGPAHRLSSSARRYGLLG